MKAHILISPLKFSEFLDAPLMIEIGSKTVCDPYGTFFQKTVSFPQLLIKSNYSDTRFRALLMLFTNQITEIKKIWDGPWMFLKEKK